MIHPIHPDPHPLACKDVVIKEGVSDPAQGAVVPGAVYEIEDWWDRLGPASWMDMDGNPACLHYAFRSAHNGLPLDNEVVYGHIKGHFGHLVHVSELGEEVT